MSAAKDRTDKETIMRDLRAILRERKPVRTGMTPDYDEIAVGRLMLKRVLSALRGVPA